MIDFDYISCRFCNEFLSTDVTERDICDECYSLRDDLAGCVLTGLCSQGGWESLKVISENVWIITDAVLNVRQTSDKVQG